MSVMLNGILYLTDSERAEVVSLGKELIELTTLPAWINNPTGWRDWARDKLNAPCTGDGVIRAMNVENLLKAGAENLRTYNPDNFRNLASRFMETRRKIMAIPDTATATVKKTETSSVRCMLEGPIMHGMKVGLADEGGTLLLEIVKQFFGDKYPDMLSTEKGQILAKMLAAGALKVLATNGVLPVDDKAIAEVCDLQLEAGSRDLIQPLLAEMTPTLKKLATLAPKNKPADAQG